MQRKNIGAVFAMVCFGTIAFLSWHGTQPARGQSQTTRVQAEEKALGVGEIDVESSRVYVHVRKTGLGHEHAVRGAIKEGEIHVGASKDAGKIVFDMTGFVAGTAEARHYVGLKGTASPSTAQQVTANMLGRDILNVRRFPTATYIIASALPLKRQSAGGNPQYQLDGTFTLHGVTRPLRVNVEAADKGDKTHVRGGFSILQTSFGITPFSKAFGAIGVDDKLTIYGEIYAAKDARFARSNAARR